MRAELMVKQADESLPGGRGAAPSSLRPHLQNLTVDNRITIAGGCECGAMWRACLQWFFRVCVCGGGEEKVRFLFTSCSIPVEQPSAEFLQEIAP